MGQHHEFYIITTTTTTTTTTITTTIITTTITIILLFIEVSAGDRDRILNPLYTNKRVIHCNSVLQTIGLSNNIEMDKSLDVYEEFSATFCVVKLHSNFTTANLLYFYRQPC